MPRPEASSHGPRKNNASPPATHQPPACPEPFCSPPLPSRDRFPGCSRESLTLIKRGAPPEATSPRRQAQLRQVAALPAALRGWLGGCPASRTIARLLPRRRFFLRLSLQGPPSRVAKCRATLSRPPERLRLQGACRESRTQQPPGAASSPALPPAPRPFSAFAVRLLPSASLSSRPALFPLCRKSPFSAARECLCRSNLDCLMVESLAACRRNEEPPESVCSLLI